MIYKLRSIKNVDVKNKKVFLRADLDVPLENGEIKDDTRLEAWMPTLKHLLKNGAFVFIAGHLGRPTKQFSIFPADSFQTGSRTNGIRRDNSQFSIPNTEKEFSLEPVVNWIKNKLELHNQLKTVDVNGFKTFEITGNVFLIENLRFYKEEEENNEEFAKKLASIAQIYVNDAFASSHRDHASIIGITKHIESYAGFRLEKEVEVLSFVLENPKRPLCVVIGGAKIETKLPLVEKMHAFADYVLVGGEIAENDKILLGVAHEKVQGKKSALLVADINETKTDITLKSMENFIQIAQNCQTIIWNGPMGVIENPENTNYATLLFAKELSEIKAYKIVGGGDTVGFLKENNLLEKFSFASIGGGAMLEFLAGEKLSGLEVLKQ